MVLDVGTGDGAFVYQSAKADPSRFYIGIDAEATGMAKTSAAALRRPEKGGVPNALFLRASAEALPSELDGVADEVHIHFPWGSLLRAVLTGDPTVLAGLRRVCAPGAWIEIVWALDPVRDASELMRLGLLPSQQGGDHPSPTEERSVGPILPDEAALGRYGSAGFRVTECDTLDTPKWPHLRTSWAKRLQGHRRLSYLIGRAD